MQPADNHDDPERGGPADESPDGPSLPLPILLRVPWFPPETTAPAAAAAPSDVAPLPEPAGLSPADAPIAASAWPESGAPRRRWPVLAMLAGCLCAIAIGAVVDEFWWSRPVAVRPSARRVTSRSPGAAPAPPAAEIEPLLAIPSAPRPEALAADPAPVPPVALAPEIIPIESGEEP